MAEQKTINTRIVLRNDTLANWEGSDKPLLRGEAALANLGNETFEIRIGTGDKSWNQLSAVPGASNLVFKSSNITDILETIAANETNTSYQITSVSLSSGETGSSFQLQSKGKFDGSWSDVEGSRFNIPAFNPKYLEDQIEDLSVQVSSFSNDWKAGVDTAITETIPQSIEDKGSTLSGYARELAEAAQKAGELSAATVRGDLTAYVQYTDVQGGSAALTGNNKIATLADVVGLSGSVHILGTIENDELSSGKSDQEVIVEEYEDARRGAIVINTTNSKEYICMAEIGAKATTADWIELGDEGLYATKSELTAAYKELSGMVVTEKERAEGIEGGLRGDINTVSGDLDKLEADSVLSIQLNGVDFSVLNNVATLDISCINCGDAKSY